MPAAGLTQSRDDGWLLGLTEKSEKLGPRQNPSTVATKPKHAFVVCDVEAWEKYKTADDWPSFDGEQDG